MATKAKKTLIKSSVVATTVDTSLSTMTKVCTDAAAAIDSISKEAKKLLLDNKRLSKKKSILLKRKKTVAGKLQKSPVADNRKMLKSIEKEIGVVSKDLEKVKSVKAKVTEELSSLRVNHKRLNAYLNAVKTTDRILNKPKAKKSKPTKKKAVLSVVSSAKPMEVAA
jgi:regulator of replication initiation timing